MEKKIINTDKAPAAPGLLSQAILHSYSHVLEISGQLGVDPSTGKLVEGIENQTKQILKNIEAILSEVGWGMENIIKIRLFLSDMNDYNTVNEIYVKNFSDTLPTRIALAVKEIPLGGLVEIECTAAGNYDKS